jgi:hypothetical protein
MPTIVHSPFDLLYGEIDCPPALPEGWELVLRANDWARAIDPQGNSYLLSIAHAYPYKQCPAEGLPCKECEGTGGVWDAGIDLLPCPACGGSGKSPLQPGHWYVDTAGKIPLG